MAGQIKNEYLEQMIHGSPADFDSILRGSARDYVKAQEQTLLDIIAHGKNSEYGKKYHFDEIKTVDDYRKNVPITDYYDYLPYIEKMKKGEEDVLFEGKPSCFVRTSGTTGKAKYIPESTMGELVKKLVMGLRAVEIARCDSGSMTAEGKMLTITNLSLFEETEGGIPVGSASGQAADANSEAAKRLVIPAAMRTASELKLEDVDYLTALFGFSESSVVMLGCNNVAHFNLLINLFNNRFEDFIRDIRSGTISVDMSDDLREKLMKNWNPNPGRADELQKMRMEKGSLTAADIWKNFSFVNCWMGSSVGHIAREMRGLFPENTIFFDLGYGASEGKFNVPDSANVSGGLIVPFGYFFEFLPLGQEKTILLQDTVDGGRYEFVLTSYSGFYRYNIHDVVEIGVGSDGTRTIEFACKSTDLVTLGQSILYSADLTDIVEKYETEHHTIIRIFQGKEIDGKLQLYVEPVDQGIDKSGFESFVESELKKHDIMLAGVEWKEDGYRDSLFARRCSDGTSVNQTKLPVFI